MCVCVCVCQLVWVEDLSLLLSASMDGTVALVDVRKRAALRVFDGHAKTLPIQVPNSPPRFLIPPAPLSSLPICVCECSLARPSDPLFTPLCHTTLSHCSVTLLCHTALSHCSVTLLCRTTLSHHSVTLLCHTAPHCAAHNQVKDPIYTDVHATHPSPRAHTTTNGSTAGDANPRSLPSAPAATATEMTRAGYNSNRNGGRGGPGSVVVATESDRRGGVPRVTGVVAFGWSREGKYVVSGGGRELLVWEPYTLEVHVGGCTAARSSPSLGLLASSPIHPCPAPAQVHIDIALASLLPAARHFHHPIPPVVVAFTVR